MVTNGYTNGYKWLQNYAQIMPDISHHVCSCGKKYAHRQGLWRHAKVCQASKPTTSTEERKDTDAEIAPPSSTKNAFFEQNAFPSVDKDTLLMMLLQQNNELIRGQQEVTLELVRHSGTHVTTTHNTTTHTNSHNKAFNLNFFLNETCKNAMNINDFVDSINLQLSDFVKVGELGFVEGISNIIVQNLNSLDETVRPIHCTDKKRETFYVKDEDVWAKEEADKKRLKKMINHVAFKNEKLMKTYKEVHPDYNNPESNRSDQYSKMVIEAMDCDEDHRAQIIRLLSKATSIQRAEGMALTLH